MADIQFVVHKQCAMFKAAMLAAIALSSATALLHSAPSRRTTRLEAKKRDYSAGGLGSSKQE